MAAPITLRSVLSILRKDAGIENEFQSIDQLAWMLLLKALDDRETEQEILDDRYRSPIPERFRWRSFTNDPELDGPALLAFLENDLFPALGSLPVSRDPTASMLRGFFQRTANHLKTPDVLRRAIDALSRVDLNHLSARRALQAEFEALLGESTASDAGAHHAPLPLARFLLEMLDPALGEAILDPSCGSGALLVAAVERLRDRWVRHPEHEATVARSIFGATPDTSSWRFATTNLLLHGLVVPGQVRCKDALSQALSRVGPGDRVDVLVGVLPFGGHADPEVADAYPVALRTTDFGALHLQHAIHVLRPEGRAALVLPDSALSSNGIMTRVREKLLEECDVHTIVRLPAGVFAPHHGSRSCILFFTRGRPTREIWYYEQQLEKNTILLVSDLARRFSEANPGREDPLTGSGVVLIDEIDAHLHPGWQRGFLPALEATFPGCQFIVSTHSPQVLSRVPRGHVFIFQDFKRVEITPYTYGRDSSSILSKLMAFAERPDDVTAKIHAAAELIEAERFDEAKAALQALGALLGEHDVEVVRLKTVLAFLDD